ncbi:MAG: DUF2178 domain-containing protein [Halobacteriota archaeon]
MVPEQERGRGIGGNEMNRQKYTRRGMIITMAIGAVVGWSVAVGNVVLPIAAMVAGMALLYLCKSRVTEVMEDELAYRISEKASNMAMRIFGLSMALIGFVLIALSVNGCTAFKQIGLTLAFSVCALLILYITFYGYYSKKGLD